MKVLVHPSPATRKEEFFKLIDQHGGWPVDDHDANFVGFEHTNERAVKFTAKSVNHGWYTTLYSADDYYLWKLSPNAKNVLLEEAKQKIIATLRGIVIYN